MNNLNEEMKVRRATHNKREHLAIAQTEIVESKIIL